MKKLTERNEKELAYTDVIGFVEALLKDETISIGQIKQTMSEADFIGKINLNVLDTEISRYVSAKIVYSLAQKQLSEAKEENEKLSLFGNYLLLENIKLKSSNHVEETITKFLNSEYYKSRRRG